MLFEAAQFAPSAPLVEARSSRPEASAKYGIGRPSANSTPAKYGIGRHTANDANVNRSAQLSTIRQEDECDTGSCGHLCVGSTPADVTPLQNGSLEACVILAKPLSSNVGVRYDHLLPGAVSLAAHDDLRLQLAHALHLYQAIGSQLGRIA